MKTYAGDDDILVADVDCTAAGKQLCMKAGVRGYPTIKYGSPAKLLTYSGGRDFKTLEAFAKKVKNGEVKPPPTDKLGPPPGKEGAPPLVDKKKPLGKEGAPPLGPPPGRKPGPLGPPPGKKAS